MDELFGGDSQFVWVAAKAALLFLTAALALRVARRRTIAEMSTVDFVAAVAVGAIVGRIPNSSKTSFLEGAVTLITVLVVHGLLSHARRWPGVTTVMDHPPIVLLKDGQLFDSQLQRASLTSGDIDSLLRRHGVWDRAQVRLLIYESKGQFSVVPAQVQDPGSAPLLAPLLAADDAGGASS